MIRLFVALLIPENTIEEIIKIRNNVFYDYKNYRWEGKNKYHLTLKFIGEVEYNLVEQIAEDLKFIENYKKFHCTALGLKYFYSYKKPSVLVMQMKVNEEIYNLVTDLNTGLEKYSIKTERKKFVPHLTMKRFRGNEGNKFLRKYKDLTIPQIEFEAERIALFKSELLPSGSRYEKIKIYNLK